MAWYSDPTAAAALGPINREFARMEKRARRICDRIEKGTISPEELERAQSEFTGMYRHVLRLTLEKRAAERAKAQEAKEAQAG